MYFSFFFIHPVQTLPEEMPPGREPAAMGALLSFAANHGKNFPFKIYLCLGKFDFTKEYLILINRFTDGFSLV